MKTVKIAWRKRKLDAKAGVYSRFASVFELKIMKIQEDAVQEKKTKATKIGLKVFKGY